MGALGAAGLACDDDDLCTTIDECSAEGARVGSEPRYCADDPACVVPE